MPMGSTTGKAGEVSVPLGTWMLLSNCSWIFHCYIFIFIFFSPQINWYFIKLAFWSVSDLGLLLGTG